MKAKWTPPAPVKKPSSAIETHDEYGGVVARLNPKWRVIVCRDGIQWILQKHRSAGSRSDVWQPESYCRTSDALRRCVRERAGEVGPVAEAALSALPSCVALLALSKSITPAVEDGTTQETDHV